MGNERYHLSAPCHFGLESVLSGELRRLGAENISATDGRVAFEGDAEMIAKSNLWLRTAERILLVLGEFHASTFTELFDGVAALPWENFIGKNDAFPVKGWSLDSALHSIPDCQSIVKKAIVKRLQSHYHVDWFQETGAKLQVQFSIRKNQAVLMLETSGPGLHKRGYREISNLAPIRETLAAGILDLARIYPDTQIYDPFCGSGTFLVESALMACKIAPGIRRRFAAEHWGCFDSKLWQNQRSAAMDQIRKNATFRGHGSDISSEAVELSLSNAKKAGVASRISVQSADIADFVVPEGKSLVVCNPPYGERMLELQEAEDLYRTMGRVFQPKDGVSYFIISPHDDFEKLFGRPANKRRKLYNGMLRCQLFMYFG